MKNKEIEKKIYEEFNEKKPEIFDKIMQHCPKMKDPNQKESILDKVKNLLFNKRFSYSFASFSLLLVALFVILGQGSTNTSNVFSTIAIDVNPSVVLELNEEDKIINVIMNNNDAIIIVGDMDLINVDYNIAVYALIGSMVSKGYLDDFKNSVLISIKSDDILHENELKTVATQTVSNALNVSSINGSIITQELLNTDEIKALAERLDISESKAKLILNITNLDQRVTVESLAKLSINDLNLYLESKNYVLEDVDKVGHASDLGNITSSEAYNLALLDLTLDVNDVTEYEIHLEQEDGIMVYEIKINTDFDEYEVLINVKDGSVVYDDDDDDVEFPSEVLSEEAVMILILAELGINEFDISDLEIDKETENGIAYYNIDFDYQDDEYELDVDALTGVIITNSMDEIDDELDEDDESDD
ncbi:hypothetical protein CI105_08305 [Candidatus Izimaplasma bacterium ZiA1]|uniref:PepSY domain-containing protein n=1 Tax=Candidatus Izimoplasma sp. ZiA1 TaxID=2024899 RepID=UPI000BAA7F95|nr:hypothetical protein CI105_08305 [Candidatus Izimaplasma bacterium ZiA1]